MMILLLILILSLTPVLADSVIIEAEEMDGNWPKGTYGGGGASGIACSATDTPLTKTVLLEGGEYKVYIRAITSPTQHATYRITVGDQQLVTPPQNKEKNLRIGWIRVGTVKVPAGPATIRIEDIGQDGKEILDAIALASDPFSDRAGRGLAFVEYILKEVDRMAILVPPGSPEEAQRRQDTMRKRLLRAIGLETLPPRTPLNPIVTGTIDRGDYIIEKVAFESRLRHVVPGLLYIPKNMKLPVPGIVGVMGHFSAGKSTTLAQQQAIGMAKRGYVMLNIDPSYAWERSIPGNSEGYDPYVSGASINGHMAWDTMRAVDYLLTRKEVDPERIGLTGASGGGQQALYAGAVDERIKAVAPAVFIWSYRDITAHWAYTPDCWPPGVLDVGDMGATLALIAPRALLVMSVTDDYASLEGSKRQVEQARSFYNALGVEKKISHFITPGPHSYPKPMREALYGFMDRWLKGVGDGSPQSEQELDPLPENSKELLVFKGGKIPADGAVTVRSFWTDSAIQLRSQLPGKNPAIARILREEILRLPARQKPIVREVVGGLLITTEPGIEIPAKLLGSGAKAVIWISERDVAVEAARDAVSYLAQKATVLVIEPRCMSMRADRDLGNQGAVLLGRPLVGMWTYDVLRAVDYLRDERGFKSISIAASGVYPGLVGLMTTVLEPGIQRAAIDGLFSSFVSIVGRNWIAEIPGILRVADVEQLAAAAGASRVAFNNLQASPVPVRIQDQTKPWVHWLDSLDW